MLRLAFAALVLMAVPAAAQAQSSCGERAKFIETLSRNYQEVPAAMAIAGQRNLVELFVSETGSWTMLVTQPNGMSCIVAAGSDWELLPPEPPKPKGRDL